MDKKNIPPEQAASSSSQEPTCSRPLMDHMYAKYRDKPENVTQLQQHIANVNTEIHFVTNVNETEVPDSPLVVDMKELYKKLQSLRAQNYFLKELLVSYLDFSKHTMKKNKQPKQEKKSSETPEVTPQTPEVTSQTPAVTPQTPETMSRTPEATPQTVEIIMPRPLLDVKSDEIKMEPSELPPNADVQNLIQPQPNPDTKVDIVFVPSASVPKNTDDSKLRARSKSATAPATPVPNTSTQSASAVPKKKKPAAARTKTVPIITPHPHDPKELATIPRKEDSLNNRHLHLIRKRATSNPQATTKPAEIPIISIVNNTSNNTNNAGETNLTNVEYVPLQLYLKTFALTPVPGRDDQATFYGEDGQSIRMQIKEPLGQGITTSFIDKVSEQVPVPPENFNFPMQGGLIIPEHVDDPNADKSKGEELSYDFLLNPNPAFTMTNPVIPAPPRPPTITKILDPSGILLKQLTSANKKDGSEVQKTFPILRNFTLPPLTPITKIYVPPTKTPTTSAGPTNQLDDGVFKVPAPPLPRTAFVRSAAKGAKFKTPTQAPAQPKQFAQAKAAAKLKASAKSKASARAKAHAQALAIAHNKRLAIAKQLALEKQLSQAKQTSEQKTCTPQALVEVISPTQAKSITQRKTCTPQALIQALSSTQAKPIPQHKTSSTQALKAMLSSQGKPIPQHKTSSTQAMKAMSTSQAKPIPQHKTPSTQAKKAMSSSQAKPIPQHKTPSTQALKAMSSSQAKPIPQHKTPSTQGMKAMSSSQTKPIPQHKTPSTQGMKAMSSSQAKPIPQHKTPSTQPMKSMSPSQARHLFKLTTSTAQTLIQAMTSAQVRQLSQYKKCASQALDQAIIFTQAKLTDQNAPPNQAKPPVVITSVQSKCIPNQLQSGPYLMATTSGNAQTKVPQVVLIPAKRPRYDFMEGEEQPAIKTPAVVETKVQQYKPSPKRTAMETNNGEELGQQPSTSDKIRKTYILHSGATTRPLTFTSAPSAIITPITKITPVNRATSLQSSQPSPQRQRFILHRQSSVPNLNVATPQSQINIPVSAPQQLQERRIFIPIITVTPKPAAVEVPIKLNEECDEKNIGQPKMLQPNVEKLTFLQPKVLQPTEKLTFVPTNVEKLTFVQPKVLQPTEKQTYVPTNVEKLTFLQPKILQPTEKLTLLQPKMVQPNVEKPTFVRPKVVQTNVEKPTFVRPKVVQTNVEKPTFVRPIVVQTNVEKPTFVQPKVPTETLTFVQPKVENLTLVQPKVEDLTLVQPHVENLTFVQPKVEDLTLAQPNVENLTFVQPKVEDLTLAQPNVENLSFVQPKVEDLTLVQPNEENLTFVHPKVLQSNVNKLTFIQPKVFQPNVEKQTYVQPRVFQPNVEKQTYVQTRVFQPNVEKQTYVQPRVFQSNLEKQTYVQPRVIQPSVGPSSAAQAKVQPKVFQQNIEHFKPAIIHNLVNQPNPKLNEQEIDQPLYEEIKSILREANKNKFVQSILTNPTNTTVANKQNISTYDQKSEQPIFDLTSDLDEDTPLKAFLRNKAPEPLPEKTRKTNKRHLIKGRAKYKYDDEAKPESAPEVTAHKTVAYNMKEAFKAELEKSAPETNLDPMGEANETYPTIILDDLDMTDSPIPSTSACKVLSPEPPKKRIRRKAEPKTRGKAKPTENADSVVIPGSPIPSTSACEIIPSPEPPKKRARTKAAPKPRGRAKSAKQATEPAEGKAKGVRGKAAKTTTTVAKRGRKPKATARKPRGAPPCLPISHRVAVANFPNASDLEYYYVAPPSEAETVTKDRRAEIEVPSFRVKVFVPDAKPCGADEEENFAYEKVHRKLEMMERRETRWYNNYLKDQDLIEKQRQRQEKRNAPKRQRRPKTIEPVWPNTKNLFAIEFTDCVPDNIFEDETETQPLPIEEALPEASTSEVKEEEAIPEASTSEVKEEEALPEVSTSEVKEEKEPKTRACKTRGRKVTTVVKRKATPRKARATRGRGKLASSKAKTQKDEVELDEVDSTLTNEVLNEVTAHEDKALSNQDAEISSNNDNAVSKDTVVAIPSEDALSSDIQISNTKNLPNGNKLVSASDGGESENTDKALTKITTTIEKESYFSNNVSSDDEILVIDSPPREISSNEAPTNSAHQYLSNDTVYSDYQNTIEGQTEASVTDDYTNKTINTDELSMNSTSDNSQDDEPLKNLIVKKQEIYSTVDVISDRDDVILETYDPTPPAKLTDKSSTNSTGQNLDNGITSSQRNTNGKSTKRITKNKQSYASDEANLDKQDAVYDFIDAEPEKTNKVLKTKRTKTIKEKAHSNNDNATTKKNKGKTGKVKAAKTKITKEKPKTRSYRAKANKDKDVTEPKPKEELLNISSQNTALLCFNRDKVVKSPASCEGIYTFHDEIEDNIPLRKLNLQK